MGSMCETDSDPCPALALNAIPSVICDGCLWVRAHGGCSAFVISFPLILCVYGSRKIPILNKYTNQPTPLPRLVRNGMKWLGLEEHEGKFYDITVTLVGF